MTRFETEHLSLSLPSSDDIPELFRFLGNEAAMQFTQTCKSIADCALFINTHENQRETVGCAPWVVRERTTDTIVGWGGLYDDPFDPGWGIELAYKFAPEAWGKGYATELACTSVNWARTELGLAILIAFSHPENLASHKVLTNAGFARKRYVTEMNRHLFELRFDQ